MSEADPEIAAMRAIVDAFTDLTDDEQRRVLLWAAERYGLALEAVRDAP